MSGDLVVYLLECDEPIRVGVLSRSEGTFRYGDEYLLRDHPLSLSTSIPLNENVYRKEEYAPYFAGLVPEGPARDALVAELGIRSGDYLAILEACGRDCVGDVVVLDADQDFKRVKTSYEELSTEDLIEDIRPRLEVLEEFCGA